MSPASSAGAAPAAGTGEVLLRVEELRTGYDRRRDVLSGVTLEVPRGRVTALVGENGSGKTTLLRALLGLLPVRGGALRWAGGSRRVGYVPQADSSEVLFPVTAHEVVLMGLVPGLGPLRRPRAADHERCRAALARLGVEHLDDRPFRALSGGQRQRVLLARGIVADPDLLALDEPVRGLDLPSSEALVATLVALARQRAMAVVVATHSLDLVANHADFVGLFRGGQVTWGPAATIFTDEQLGRHYGTAVHVRRVEGRRVVVPGTQAPATDPLSAAADPGARAASRPGHTGPAGASPASDDHAPGEPPRETRP